MPTLITREEALSRILEEGGRPSCLMCAILERQVVPVYVVHEDTREPGDAAATSAAGVTSWSCPASTPPHSPASTPDAWARTARTAHQAARMVERVLQPLRCYLASVGSSAGELPQTSMHLHMHVIPLFAAEDRPSDVFSWAEGVMVGEPHEWLDLQARYREVWADCAV